jgi:hypothetical protein
MAKMFGKRLGKAADFEAVYARQTIRMPYAGRAADQAKAVAIST